MVIKHSILYVLSSVFSKAIPFLLLPILTHYLNPTEFGQFSIFQVILAFAIALFGMNIQTNITVNYFRVNKEKLSLFFGNILLILLCNSFLLFVFLLVYGYYSSSIFSISIEYIYFLPLLILFTVIVEIYTSLLRSQKKVISFVVVEVLSTVLRFTLVSLLIVYFALGWESFLIGSIITLMLFSIYSIYSLYRQNYIDIKYNKKIIKSILLLSIPLIPHAIGGMVIAMSDRLFIEQIVGIKEVGIYAVGYSFGMIVSLFSDAFVKAWSPWFYEKMNNLNEVSKSQIVKATYLYMIFILLLSIVIYLISLFLIPFMTSTEYHSATKYVFWIALAYSIQGIYKIFFPYLVHFSKTKYLAITTLLAAILSFIGNYFFINQYGAVGAAYSTILAFIVNSIGVAFIAMKQVKLPWLIFFK